jgi:hypothetical protein
VGHRDSASPTCRGVVANRTPAHDAELPRRGEARETGVVPTGEDSGEVVGVRAGCQVDGGLAQVDLAFVCDDGPFRRSHDYATAEQADRLYACWGF